MRKDLLFSLKEEKVAISYRKSFPLLFPWLPMGTTLKFFGLAPPQTGACPREEGRGGSLSLFGRKTANR